MQVVFIAIQDVAIIQTSALIIQENITSSNGIGIGSILGGNGNVSINNNSNIVAMGPGIFGVSGGNSNVSISNIGNVTSTSAYGIFSDVDGTGSITVQHSGGTISGTTGILVDVRDMMAAANITVAGSVTGTGGTAINFRGDGNDVLNLVGGHGCDYRLA